MSAKEVKRQRGYDVAIKEAKPQNLKECWFLNWCRAYKEICEKRRKA